MQIGSVKSSKKLLAGLLVLVMVLSVVPVWSAPVYPITSPKDARTWGLDSLGNFLRKPGKWFPTQTLVLNPKYRVPLPKNLGDFVKDRKAALVLGKALFWDMQVGSDGIQTCASCHYQAGADVRTKNQVSTVGSQVYFERNGDIIGFFNAPRTNSDPWEEINGRLWGPNFKLTGEDFPLVITQNAYIPNNPQYGDIVAADTGAKNRNDVVGSMGLMAAEFAGVTPGSPVDNYTGPLGIMRQTTGRNAPSTINAVFNLFQFWDGRAHPRFNGFNPIGPHDTPKPRYFVNNKGKLQQRVLNMEMASLASQSTGPPLSDVEMSFRGRTWPDIGKKLLRAPEGGSPLTPLAYQRVSPTDSVLGPYVNPSGYGLNKTYADLVKAAFQDYLWNIDTESVTFPKARLVRTTADEQIYIQGPCKIHKPAPGKKGKKPLPIGYTQMEANFSLFFGIAIMLYEAELVSEQTKFDQWMEGKAQLSIKELDGLNVFVKDGRCIACHGGPELTNATVRYTRNGKAQIEPMRKRNGVPTFYDNGFYNVGITPTVDDILRGDKDPNGKPWGSSRQFLFQKNGIMNIPFDIVGLPIMDLEARNPVDTNGDGIYDKQELWKIADEPGESPDEILVCYDLNMNGVCDLQDDIVIQDVSVDGSCKVGGLRNIELNGPYFHNGGAATLQQILDNYDIGGKFSKEILNTVDMQPDLDRLDLGDKTGPNGTPAEEALLAFLLALTDNRVRTEAKPFDHPQLFIPIDGTVPILNPADPAAFFAAQIMAGKMIELPATGAAGGAPLQPFLGLDPTQADTGKGNIVEEDSS